MKSQKEKLLYESFYLHQWLEKMLELLPDLNRYVSTRYQLKNEAIQFYNNPLFNKFAITRYDPIDASFLFTKESHNVFADVRLSIQIKDKDTKYFNQFCSWQNNRHSSAQPVKDYNNFADKLLKSQVAPHIEFDNIIANNLRSLYQHGLFE